MSGLLPETTYSLTLAAYTTKGDGARSKAKVVTTTGAGVCVCVSCNKVYTMNTQCNVDTLIMNGERSAALGRFHRPFKADGAIMGVIKRK